MSVTENLRTARDGLPGHWNKGTYGNSYTACALGHIALARKIAHWSTDMHGDTWLEIDNADGLMRTSEVYVLAEVLGCDPSEPDRAAGVVVEINDNPTTTEEQMYDYFDRAVKIADERGL